MKKYIEVEQAAGILQEMADDHWETPFFSNDYNYGKEQGIRIAREAIKNLVPCADVQEVRHGRWEEPEDPTCYKCSVCGKYATQEYGCTAPIFWHYCPNCGAKMDEEE